MRLLNRYIQKELFFPFCYSLVIIIFILFTNFLLRAVDRFLGKGIDLSIILEYLFFNLAWIVSLAVPMAVLIAALMTFGRMSEDNEINAMRSSGISFLKIIKPAILFGVIVCMLLIYFNNFILPEMNFRARLLSGDIYRKRPGLNINPGHFIDEIPDYSMIIRGEKDNVMEDVRIFSKNNRETQTSIHSKTGTLSTIDDAFILTLYEGEIHEMDLKNYENYRRIEFKKHVITVPADDLLLNRRDSSSRSDREMKIPLMLERKKYYQDRIEKIHHRLTRSFERATGDSIFPESVETGMSLVSDYKSQMESDTTLTRHEKQRKLRRLSRLESQVRNEHNLINNYSRNINKYGVEIHKKFSLPFACILFVVTGASLGVLTKKGGFAIGTSVSLGFFIVYYIFLIGGEDMADRNIVSPFVGLWTPNLILLIIGLYLTLHTVREQAPFNKSEDKDNNIMYFIYNKEKIEDYPLEKVILKFFQNKLYRIDIAFSSNQPGIYNAFEFKYGKPLKNNNWKRGDTPLKGMEWKGTKVICTILAKSVKEKKNYFDKEIPIWDSIILYNKKLYKEAQQYIRDEDIRKAIKAADDL